MNLNEKKAALFVDVVSGLFILLFGYSALSKIIEFDKFKIDLGKSPILNVVPLPWAYVVPLAEALILVALFVKRFQLKGLFAAFSIMVAFSAYIVTILAFSTYVPCSCGGILQSMSWHQHLVFNAAFVLLALAAVLLYPENTKVLIRDKREYRNP